MKLQPTFRLLWGIPGRSNALNTAARIGLDLAIVEAARKRLGTALVRLQQSELQSKSSPKVAKQSFIQTQTQVQIREASLRDISNCVPLEFVTAGANFASSEQ